MPITAIEDAASIHAEVERLQFIDHLLAIVLGEFEDLELAARGESAEEMMRRYDEWVAAGRPDQSPSREEIAALRDRVVEFAAVESTLDDLTCTVRKLRRRAVAEVGNSGVGADYRERMTAGLTQLVESHTGCGT